MFGLGEFLDEILHSLSNVDIIWIYLFVFLAAYLENVFSPLPGDSLVISGGMLIGLRSEHIGVFFLVILVATLGSSAGFMTYYLLGYFAGRPFFEKRKIISNKDLAKLDKWYDKWGYLVILANRFLPGLRSIISITTGIAKFKPLIVFILASISCLIWNGLMLYIGKVAGENWKYIKNKIEIYLMLFIGLILLIFIVKVILQRYKQKVLSSLEEENKNKDLNE